MSEEIKIGLLTGFITGLILTILFGKPYIPHSDLQSSDYCQTDDDCVFLLGCECGCYNKDYKPKEPPFRMTCTCEGFFENIECICKDNKCTPKQ